MRIGEPRCQRGMKYASDPTESTHFVCEQPPLAFGCLAKGRKRETLVSVNQLTIIETIGRKLKANCRFGATA
jgi:hypothetical protein